MFPEIHEALDALGSTNHKVFRLRSPFLGYAECEPDVVTAVERMAKDAASEKWADDALAGVANRPPGRAAEAWRL